MNPISIKIIAAKVCLGDIRDECVVQVYKNTLNIIRRAFLIKVRTDANTWPVRGKTCFQIKNKLK